MDRSAPPGGSRRRTSIVMGAFRARQLAALIRARGDDILTEADLYKVATSAGMRKQAIEHAVDLLIPGFEGERLDQDEYGRPRLVREAAG